MMEKKPPIASLAIVIMRLHLSWEVQVCVQDYADFCVCIWTTNSKYSKVRFTPIVRWRRSSRMVNYYESRDSNCTYNMLWKAQHDILEIESYKSGVNITWTWSVYGAISIISRIMSTELHRKRDGKLRKFKHVSEAKLIRDIDAAGGK